MDTATNYIAINRAAWNDRTDVHYTSAFYDVAGFLEGRSSLNAIELELLGQVQGKRILHLQCHFGQDSISLARLGATVTGVDLSDKAVDRARELAAATGADATFICADIYDLPDHLDQQFDLVFTSYGTIGWLPDLDRWACIIARYLKPGGRFVFAEFHPVVWMFDAGFERVAYDYFNTGAIIETESGTYADRSAPLQPQSVSWNHSISEVVNSLVRHGLSIESLNEFDYSPYDCFRPGAAAEPGKFRIAHLQHKIPMVYSILATKKTDA